LNGAQAPLEHAGVAPEHCFVQPPQWLASLARSTQLPPQLVLGGLHAAEEQAPATHTCPAAHWTLHAPQVAGLVRSASHPSVGLALQSAHPAQHVEPHPLATQVGIAWAANGQAVELAVQGPQP
jgi:hypothetical protein